MLIDAVKPGTSDKLPVKVTYTRDGVATEDITAPGDYVATILIDDGNYDWGGMATLKFHVAATRVDVDEIYASYKGETLKSASVRDIYSGEDLMANLTVKAIDEDDKEVPADQLTLTVTDEDGEEVEGVVEAGTYTVTIGTVEGSLYQIKGGTDEITFTVDPVRATDDSDANASLRLTGTMGFGDPAGNRYIYTGEAVVPGFEYDLFADMWGYGDYSDWKALPTESYKVSYQKKNEKTKKWEDVEECVEVGEYRAVLTDATLEDSYVVDINVYFYITDTKVFQDVPNDFWAAKDIYTAADNKWMSGYGYTGFFGPNDNIKRGDVAVVLYKMAGQPEFVDEGEYDENTGFKTGFDDVDGKMYYAEAILWARQAGHRLRRHRHRQVPPRGHHLPPGAREDAGRLRREVRRGRVHRRRRGAWRVRGRGHRLRVGRGLRRLPRRGRRDGQQQPAARHRPDHPRRGRDHGRAPLRDRRLRQRDVQVIPRHGLRSHAKGRLPGRGASLLLSLCRDRPMAAP